MILFVFALILFSLSYVVLIRQIRINAILRLILIVLFLLISFKNPILVIFGGNLLAPQLPGPIIIGASAAQLALIIAVFFGLVLELFLFIVSIVFKVRAGNAFRICLFLIVITSASCISFIATCNADLPPQNTFYTFRDAKYPDSFRIVHLTDTHIGTNVSPERVRDIVRQVNELNPDVIIHTGDIIDGKYEAIAPQVDELKGLKAKYGVYAVNGNHEYYSSAPDWEHVWKKLNIRMINNANVTITDDFGRKLLVLAGVSDPAARKYGLNMSGPDYEAALDGVDGSLPVIMLSHRPAEFPNCATAGADITFSGHTHGGMIPVLKQIVSLTNGGYVSGYYEHKGKKMITGNGTILWAGFYARINDPAEIVVVDLKKK